ncbi:MAG: hypothetical protein Q8876_09480 [Bacillota bacterium]|nr:hypothetical protein [Bacillota bacterium]
MNENASKMLELLDNEIELKCYEIKKARQERSLGRCFSLLSVLFVIIPVLLVFFGISFVTMVIPALIFLVAGTFLLSPIILQNKIGGLQ